MSIFYIRVVKQALRSSGANVTEKHILEISQCALFLLEAAKKCDNIFGVSPSTTAHTVRDFKFDIAKIQSQLMDKKITTENPLRTTPVFIDPTVSGLKTLTGGWLEKQLSAHCEDILQNEQLHGEVDIDYELADVD